MFLRSSFPPLSKYSTQTRNELSSHQARAIVIIARMSSRCPCIPERGEIKEAATDDWPQIFDQWFCWPPSTWMGLHSVIVR